MKPHWIALGLALCVSTPAVLHAQNPIAVVEAGKAARGVGPLTRALRDAIAGGYVLSGTELPRTVPTTIRELAQSNADVRTLLSEVANGHASDGVLEAITKAGFSTNEIVTFAVQYEMDERVVHHLTSSAFGGGAQARLCGTGSLPAMDRITAALNQAQVFGGYESVGAAGPEVIAVGTGQPLFETLRVVEVSPDGKTLRIAIPGRSDQITLQYNEETGIYNGFGGDNKLLTEVAMVLGEEGYGDSIVLRTVAKNGSVTFFRGRLNRNFSEGIHPTQAAIKEGEHVFGGIETSAIGTNPMQETLFVQKVDGGYEVRIGRADAEPIKTVYEAESGNFVGVGVVKGRYVDLTIPRGDDGWMSTVRIRYYLTKTDPEPLATFDGTFNTRATLERAMSTPR